MLPRAAATEIARKLRTFPVVTILGPRQVGKTTLARSALPGWRYLDLERPADRAPLQADPEDRLRSLGDRVILDEAQLAPELFPVLRGLVDEHRKKNGRYVLLGSASPTLVRGISESLAGRSALLDLPQLEWSEFAGGKRSLDDLWLRGGFPTPALSSNAVRRFDWFDAYVRTFVERDLAALGVDVSAARMRQLLGMLAHAHGALWNSSRIAAALGTNYHTVNRYLDILEQSFLVRRLRPLLPNLGKRLTRSPKIYLRDTGLLHHFLGIQSREQLSTSPSRGVSWESLVIEHVLASFAREAPGSEGFFFRSATGIEVDLVMQRSGDLVPFEIKSHTSPGRDSLKGLFTFMRDLGVSRGYVIARSAEDYSLGDGVTVLSAKTVLADPARLASL
ncbi:MAG TPA: ATP-binding protein [Polyangiaceae bacterium]